MTSRKWRLLVLVSWKVTGSAVFCYCGGAGKKKHDHESKIATQYLRSKISYLILRRSGPTVTTMRL